MPKDFLGQEIKPGHIIAVAQTRGRSGARLTQRFVREVHDDHLVVQPGPEEPTDKRQLGRVSNFTNSIIIS